MRGLAYVLLTLVLGACGASMVTPPGSATPVENAPINEAARPGEVKYRNDGISSIREARRKDAYKKMAEACGGKYRIDREGEEKDGTVTWAEGSSTTNTVGAARGAATTTSNGNGTTTTASAQGGSTSTTTASTTSSTTSRHYVVIQFSCVRDSASKAAADTTKKP